MLPKLTLQRLMAAIAVCGIGMSAFRVHPALGSFVFGVSSMALLRAARIVDRLREAGSKVRPLFIVRTFLVSWLLAALILIASLLPSFCLLPLVGTSKFDAGTVVAIVILAITGIPIASFLRRKLW